MNSIEATSNGRNKKRWFLRIYILMTSKPFLARKWSKMAVFGQIMPILDDTNYILILLQTNFDYQNRRIQDQVWLSDICPVKSVLLTESLNADVTNVSEFKWSNLVSAHFIGGFHIILYHLVNVRPPYIFLKSMEKWLNRSQTKLNRKTYNPWKIKFPSFKKNWSENVGITLGSKSIF